MSAFTEERNREFYKAFLKAWSIPHVSYREAARIAIHTQTYRYWISEYSLWREILRREHGCKWNSNRKKSRQEKIYSYLYRRYLALHNGSFRNHTAYFIAELLVNSPAPGFFISEFQALQIIRKMRKKYART